MVGGERYITEELKNFEDKILNSEKRRQDLEFELFILLCSEVVGHGQAILNLSTSVAELDVAVALAKVAVENEFVRPVVDDTLDLDIGSSWHPTVAKVCRELHRDFQFVPNSLSLEEARSFILITGPNMGGKSTLMRQMALVVLLAQIGSFVPAKRARIGLVDRIFTRIGSSDNIAEGASTFMVEMSEMSFTLRQATARSLVLLDEIGRGTSTYDGLSLAWALVSHLCQSTKCRTLFATHYHELTALEGKLAGLRNMRVGVEVVGGEKQIVRFLYKLEPGASERSYGILVARLAGLPESVLTYAEAVLAQLEGKSLSEGDVVASEPDESKNITGRS
jgi:DNA mismatch repair protein MutS